MKRLIAAFAMLLGVVLTAGAQTFEWDVHFQTRFDNRENANVPLAKSRTIFGSVLSPTIGVAWGEGSQGKPSWGARAGQKCFNYSFY